MCTDDLRTAFLRELQHDLYNHLRWNGSSSPQDLAQEAITILLERVAAEGGVLDERGFAFGVAKNLLKKEHEKRQKERRLLADMPEPSSQDSTDKERLARWLEDCLKKLPLGDRKLIEKYYSFGPGKDKVLGRKKMAIARRISMEVLRERVWRIVDGLRNEAKDAPEDDAR